MGITKLLAIVLIVYGMRTLYIRMTREAQAPRRNGPFPSGFKTSKKENKKKEDVSDGEWKEVSH